MAQYDPKDHLAKAVERVKVRDRLDMPNVLEIMSYSRNLLEARGSKAQYPIVGLYCDWCLHTELDRSELIQDLLLAIPGSMFGQPDLDAIIREISTLFQVQALRKQLRDLFIGEKIDTFLFDIPGVWRLFLGQLFQIIEGKRLKFPESAGAWSNKKAKQKYDAMVASMGAHHQFAPESVHLERVENRDEFTVEVVITTKGQFFVRTPLL